MKDLVCLTLSPEILITTLNVFMSLFFYSNSIDIYAFAWKYRCLHLLSETFVIDPGYNEVLPSLLSKHQSQA